MLICDDCGKKTRKPKIRKGHVFCPKCFKAFLKSFIKILRRV